VVKPFVSPCCLHEFARSFQVMKERRRGFPIGPYSFRPGSKLLVNERGSKVRLTEKKRLYCYLYRSGESPFRARCFCKKCGVIIPV
jgi:hypothetical protein